MKILMLRDTVAGGKAVSIGDKITIKDDEAHNALHHGQGQASRREGQEPEKPGKRRR